VPVVRQAAGLTGFSDLPAVLNCVPAVSTIASAFHTANPAHEIAIIITSAIADRCILLSPLRCIALTEPLQSSRRQTICNSVAWSTSVTSLNKMAWFRRPRLVGFSICNLDQRWATDASLSLTPPPASHQFEGTVRLMGLTIVASIQAVGSGSANEV
jgi:hypothetical protein